MEHINWEVVSKLGVPIVLAVSLSIGIFLSALWLVKNLLKSYEKEREQHQIFLSDAVKSNTEAIRNIADRINDNMNMNYRFVDGITNYINRMETADRYQREEHIKIIQLLETACLKMQNISERIQQIGGI
jgi:cell division protein FtsX